MSFLSYLKPFDFTRHLSSFTTDTHKIVPQIAAQDFNFLINFSENEIENIHRWMFHFG